MLLDNYLPDGKGITLISNPMLTRANCSVIFHHRRQRYGHLQPGHS